MTSCVGGPAVDRCRVVCGGGDAGAAGRLRRHDGGCHGWVAAGVEGDDLEVLQYCGEGLRRTGVRQEGADAACEAELGEIDAAFHQFVLEDRCGRRAVCVAADPAAAADVAAAVDVDRDRGAAGLLVVRREFPARVAHRAIGGLRSGVGGAVPLVERGATERAARGEVDREQEVAFGAVAAERPFTRGRNRHRALHELEVDVAVTVVDDPLGAEEHLVRRPGDVRGRVDVGQVILVRNAGGAERVGREQVAIGLGPRACVRGRVAGPARGRVARERIDLETGVGDGGVRGSGRCARRGGRRRVVPVEVTAIEDAAGAGATVRVAGRRQRPTIGPIVGAGSVENNVGVRFQLHETRWRRTRVDTHQRRRRDRQHKTHSPKSAAPKPRATRPPPLERFHNNPPLVVMTPRRSLRVRALRVK